MSGIEHSRTSKPIHEFGIPVFPYGVNAYNALSAVIQGFALGALGFQLNSHFATGLTNEMCVQAATAFLLISVIWHRYITHLHFVAWMPRSVDTMILLGWAIVEFLLAYTATQSASLFSIFVAAAGMLGVASYTYVWLSFKKPIVTRAFREHYTDEATSDAVLKALRRFNMVCLLQISCVSASLIAVALAIHYEPTWVSVFVWKWLPVNGDTVLILYAVVLTLFFLFKFDLQWHLKRDPRTVGFLG